MLRNADTTLSRLSARAFFWPLPFRQRSRSVGRLGFEVERLEPVLQRLRTHAALEVRAEPVAHFAVEHFVALEVLHLEALEAAEHFVETVDFALRPLADLPHLTLGAFAHLALHVTLGAFGFECGEVFFELLGARVDVDVLAVFDLLAVDRDLRLDARQVAVAGVVVDPRDHVGGEVDDLLEILRRKVEQVTEPARHTLEVPDVGDRSGQLDVAHPLTTHLGAGDLDATALADDALEADPLVLPAVALPVAGRTEDLLAEQPVLLRTQRAVVDRLGLLDLTV